MTFLSHCHRLLSGIPGVGNLLNRVSRMERDTLVVLALTAGAFYLFLTLADEVMEGDTRSLDERILLALRVPGDLSNPIGPRWLEESMRDLTALGGTTVLTLMTLAVLCFLLMVRKHQTAILLAVSVAGGAVLSSLLKWGYSRPRPELVPHGMDVYSASFPSGHSMMSAVVYLTLGAILARTQARWRVKAFLFGLAIALTLLVGASRLYLGVHWPTDVLGGWTLGAGWAALCWLVMLYLQSQGEVEPEEPAPDPAA
ncbi:phosphatase PAP2 family protein [Azorhizobium doebereinerae]|uniref:phosphatase PAP2 family protein n=1 Tax=Azorhizobium doebereinerae TaxID=281091 RepID=UPI000418A3A7|nr:phosphatase PAP2 family protein [Azorhizobium doebereinerae]